MGAWPKTVSEAQARFVFSVAIAALLFRLMSDFSRLPSVDPRLLIAYFGNCFIVSAAGRFIANRVCRLDAVSQSVFAPGGIFANNVLLGISLAKVTLVDAWLPAVSLILVFNSLGGPVAASLGISTALTAVTTPLILALTASLR
jgi:predicted permease